MNEKNKDIATRVKGLRLLSGLSIEEVAKTFGVSATLYEQYEKGEDDIPVSLLNEISNYYGVDMTEILTGTSPKLRDVCYVKKGEGLRVERYDQYEFQSLAYKYAKRKIEPLLVTLIPGKDPELVSHKGQEFNYCLEGRMKVIVGQDEYILEPGDSLYFNPMILHKMLPLDNKEAKFLTVILL
ncbi:MAG TPA: helix-turn-helix transcriptional regulator [Clostridiaceae bacterium]|nr:helix-turn-helix transcriptional regulator [Clostridiaceae bacterium]